MLVFRSQSQGKKNTIDQCRTPLPNSILSIFMLTLLMIISATKLSAQTNDDCLACHSDETMTMERKGKEVSIYVNDKVLAKSPHAKLNCISCHVGFDPDNMPHKENIQPINCKSCHKNAALKHPFHPRMLKSSGQGGTADVNCKGCHGTHDIVSPKVPGSKFYKTNIVEACEKCHAEEGKEYSFSAHYEGLKEGVEGAPNCFTCHKNNILAPKQNADTVKVKIAQEKLCLSCHQDNPEVRARTTPSAGFIKAFENSVHGSLLKSGNGKAATCIDCHTPHGIKGPNDPTSTVNKFNIPKTCSKCHAEIAKEYEGSIHGVAVLQKGIKDAPVCTDCHGEHNILRINDPRSPVSKQNLSAQVCAPCHSSVKLSQKFGMNSDRFKTFKQSYHGLALEGGSTVVANCASCHGVHNIKPSSDPTSTVYKGNLAKTCGKCHPGANENFAKGKIHITIMEKSNPILYWIGTIYISLIIITIGGMFLHNLLDFIKKAKIKKMKQSGLIREEHHGHKLYLRMTKNERFQHFALLISFITLVITGFMLHYPNAWWAVYLRKLSVDAFEYRSNLHRIAAVVLVGASLYHIYYLAFTERGKQLFKDLLPVYRDLQEAIGVAKFNLGLSKEKPKLSRFSYIEKAEYWALIWGTVVMTLTGIIMWFDNTFIGIFTKSGYDIAHAIHYFEAWLATLAIIVWHFYFVIFSPDVYPMNLAWLKGTLTEEEMAEEHPAELEELKAKEAEEEKKKMGDQETDK